MCRVVTSLAVLVADVRHLRTRRTMKEEKMNSAEYAAKVARLETMVRELKRCPPPHTRVELISNVWECFADIFNDAYGEAFDKEEAAFQIQNDERLR